MHSKELFKRLINDQISKEEFEELIEKVEDTKFLKDADAYLKKEFENEIAEYKIEQGVLKKEKDREIKIIPIKGSAPSGPKKKKIGNKGHLPNAAIILLLLTVAFGVLYLLSNTTLEIKNKNAVKTDEATALITKTTPFKQMFRMKLSDGSFVHMNSVSKITYPQQFSDSSRNIALAGEAYFNVARNEKKMFTVNVKNYKVQVLGTSFNIEAYEEDDDFSVTVESGTVKVQLEDDVEPVILTKNQKLIYNGVTGEQKVLPANTEKELFWRNGILRFDATPMKKVEHMLERWYGVNITIADSSIYKKTLSGIHKNENIKSVLESISYATNTKYYVENNSVIIRN